MSRKAMRLSIYLVVVSISAFAPSPLNHPTVIIVNDGIYLCANESFLTEGNNKREILGYSRYENGCPLKNDEPDIKIDYATKDLLEQPNDFIEFIAEESEYQAKIVFSTNTKVRDFKVLSLQMENVTDDGEMSFSLSDELYCLDELTAKKPLVVGMVFIGTIPNMGISYIDENNVYRTYALSISGFDGKPLLIESSITPKQD